SWNPDEKSSGNLNFTHLRGRRFISGLRSMLLNLSARAHQRPAVFGSPQTTRTRVASQTGRRLPVGPSPVARHSEKRSLARHQPTSTNGGAMRALTYQGKRHVSVDEVPDPQLREPTDAIIRVTSAAICGSDLHLYELFGP